MRPSSVVVAVVLAAISVLPSFELVSATDCDESGSCYTNPVVSSNTPDPGVLMLPDGLGYTVVSTSNFAVNSTEGAFKILHSKDLVHWSFVSCRLFLFKKAQKMLCSCSCNKTCINKPKCSQNSISFSSIADGICISPWSVAFLGVQGHVGTRVVLY